MKSARRIVQASLKCCDRNRCREIGKLWKCDNCRCCCFVNLCHHKTKHLVIIIWYIWILILSKLITDNNSRYLRSSSEKSMLEDSLSRWNWNRLASMNWNFDWNTFEKHPRIHFNRDLPKLLPPTIFHSNWFAQLRSTVNGYWVNATKSNRS